jgi:hypothetical protein
LEYKKIFVKIFMMPVRAMQTRRGSKRGLKGNSKAAPGSKRSKKSKLANDGENISDHQEMGLNVSNVHINQLPSHILVY